MDVITAELKRQGRTRYWLAKQVGVRPDSIYRWFTGKNGPTAANIDRMCKTLGLRTTPAAKPSRGRP